MLFLAVRQLLSRINQTVLTFVGIMLGAAGYVVFTGIMAGYHEYMIDKLIANDAHVRISPRDEYITPDTFKGIFYPREEIHWLSQPSGRIDYSRLTNVPFWLKKAEEDGRVAAYSPQIIREVIFTRGKFSVPGKIIGIDPLREMKITNVHSYMTEGSYTAVSRGISLVAIGQNLMLRLGARINDTITMVTPGGTVVPLKIVGVFRTGLKMVDERVAYSSIATVQSATGSSGEITDISIKLHDINAANELAAEYATFGTDTVESWDQVNESILFMFRTQNIVRNSTTITIILVVAFGIYNVLNMSVNHKKREIAILRSMGYGQKDIILLFLYQGLIVGVMGSILGLTLGWAACKYIESIPIVAGGKRAWITVNHMMISWDAMIYVKAFLLVTASSLIASFIPARAAGKLAPLDIIRGAA